MSIKEIDELLAALFDVQHGLAVSVLDRATDGAEPGMVREAGATHHTDADRDISFRPDVAIERTGGD